MDKAVALKREIPERSVSQIIEILERSGAVEPGVIKRTTLGRHMRKLLPPDELRRIRGSELKRGYRRFEAKARNDLWQGDCQHGPYLPDPQNRADPLTLDNYALIAASLIRLLRKAL